MPDRRARSPAAVHPNREGDSVTEDPAGDQTADALAYVCERLDYLRTVLPRDDGAGDPPALRALFDALARGRDVTGPLEDVHTGLLNAGDALGVWGHAGSGRRNLNLRGIDDALPFEVVYLCPLGRCSGRLPHQVTTFPTTCPIAGRELRRERL